MKVRMLRKIQKFLLEEPRRFDMSNWIRDSRHCSTLLEKPPCGTACCIAGAAVIVDRKEDPASVLTELNGTTHLTIAGFDIEVEAIEILGLTTNQKERLFFVSNWPAKFRYNYQKATTALTRARVGVRRIEHFIKTKGKE